MPGMGPPRAGFLFDRIRAAAGRSRRQAPGCPRISVARCPDPPEPR